jgi:hypothetical protein
MFSRLALGSYLFVGSLIILQHPNNPLNYIGVIGLVTIFSFVYEGYGCKFLSMLLGSIAASIIVFSIKSKALQCDRNDFRCPSGKLYQRVAARLHNFNVGLENFARNISLYRFVLELIVSRFSGTPQQPILIQQLENNQPTLFCDTFDFTRYKYINPLVSDSLEFQYSIERIFVASSIAPMVYFILDGVIYETKVATGVLVGFLIWSCIYLFNYALYRPIFIQLCSKVAKSNNMRKILVSQFDQRRKYFGIVTVVFFLVHFCFPIPFLYDPDQCCIIESQEQLIFCGAFALNLLIVFFK